MRILAGLAMLAALGGAIVSGSTATDSVRHSYLPATNVLRTVTRYGDRRAVAYSSLGRPMTMPAGRRCIGETKPLGRGAPSWAQRLYRRSLLVLEALIDPRTGAAVAGGRHGWAYVWPRDASTVAMALASAGCRSEARRVVRFLLGLDLGAAARFHLNGAPVDGRGPQGDAPGWVAAATKAVGLADPQPAQPWRDRADYQEGGSGDYLGNAIASTPGREIRADFGVNGVLVRRSQDPGSGVDSAAAWAVRPFPHPALFPLVRRTLLRIAAHSNRFGILPSEDWAGGEDPWTAPTAWTAWGLAALGERRAALRLIAELHRDETRDGLLPERVDARTGVPTSTTPLAWSHAFAILALRQLWP